MQVQSLRPQAALLPVVVCLFVTPASAQITFSIDSGSSSIGIPDSGYGAPIREGDVLAAELFVPALGPLDAPRTIYSAGFGPAPGLGLGSGVICSLQPCPVEVDALSYGPVLTDATQLASRIAFSTDRFARGNGAPMPPTIWTEAPVGDQSADILVDLGVGLGPISPFGPVAPFQGSVSAVDGNGRRSGSGYLYPGVGLLEPLLSGPASGVDFRDNMDGLAVQYSILPVLYPVYFSLDAAWVDPLTGIPNTGSAMAHGFLPGDVLLTTGLTSGPVVYAAAAQLGLDLLGAGLDDLDALILRENGQPGYQPSMQPNDWLSGASDMLLFSVRRGSSIIGQPDSIFGIPIEEGDLLTVPLLTGTTSPFPGIYIPAEQLGLATVRSGGTITVFGDELNAAELLEMPLRDCNGNGIEDAVDVAYGYSEDVNDNGVPDECEGSVISFCFCPTGAAPCSNGDASAGCANSTGVGALMEASGSASVTADDLVLTTTSQPLNQSGLVFMGAGVVGPTPFGDGLRCVGGPFYRFPIRNSGLLGGMVEGPGIVAWSLSHFPASGQIQPGDSWSFQNWYRDPQGPCSNFFSLSSALRVSFTP